MAELLPLPSPGDVFTDVRGEDRTMRVSYHQDSGIVVVSMWAGRTCRASFRVAPADASRLAVLLTEIAGSTPEPTAGEPSEDTGDGKDSGDSTGLAGAEAC
jgi:hypothetical protein